MNPDTRKNHNAMKIYNTKPLHGVSIPNILGQSIVEYLIIVSLVAIVGIAAFTYLGQSIHQAAVESVVGITNNNI